MKIIEARKLLENVPSVSLGFFPTPMYKLEKLSKMLGVNLYIKRDDFTGKNLFGGNKTRKLEYLIGKALEGGYEYTMTYGATQSNHAMQTVWTSVSNGLKPILYLTAVVEPDENDIKANHLLDKIFEAEVNVISMEQDETFMEAEERSFKIGTKRIEELDKEGHKCFEIPMGGANDIGSAGYIAGMIELCEQAEQMGVEFEHLYHASGTGGTMAGLVAGKKLLRSNMNVHSIMVLDIDETYIPKRVKLANDALKYIGALPLVEETDFIVNEDFFGDGYEKPTFEATEAIKILAKEEGLLLDPVYTGKGFSAMLSDIRNGRIEQGSNVVFLHTGGTTGLFAEKEILGDIL